VIENRAILLRPYERDGSYSFFRCVKKNDGELFDIFIQRCRFYVLDINHHHKTCLHIASEKGYLGMLQKILAIGCEIDKGDLLYGDQPCSTGYSLTSLRRGRALSDSIVMGVDTASQNCC
jgi:hypothetical protein